MLPSLSRRDFLTTATAAVIGPGACWAVGAPADGEWAFPLLGDLHIDRPNHHDHDWVKQTHPRWRYELIPLEVLPALRARGLPEETIRTLMVDTPRRILEVTGPY